MHKIWINGRFLTQNITGVQRYAIEVVCALDALSDSERGFSCELVIPKNAVIKTKIELKRVRVIRRGYFGGHFWEQFFLPITFFLSRDVAILLNLANTGPLLTKRQIVVIHDVAYFHNPRWFSWRFSFLYRKIIPLLAKRCRKILTDSSFSKNEILRYIPGVDTKVSVVFPGGVSTSAFKVASGIANKVEAGRYVLAVSSIDPRKNFERLIKAFVKLKDIDVNLLIVGAPNKVFGGQDLKALISADSRIRFLGHLSDSALYDIYRNAQLFVYPSLYEGFGLPPLEAMSFGCPVLTSNLASIPEACSDGAYYVNPYDVDALSAAMRRLLEDIGLRKELVSKGYKNLRRFSWNTTAKNLSEEVRSACI